MPKKRGEATSYAPVGTVVDRVIKCPECRAGVTIRTMQRRYEQALRDLVAMGVRA